MDDFGDEPLGQSMPPEGANPSGELCGPPVPEPIFLDSNGTINPNRVINGKIYLTEYDLMSELDYFINDPLNYPKTIGDLAGADTRFHKGPARKYRYVFNKKSYGSTEVNYIGVGRGARDIMVHWELAKHFPEWHNNGLPGILKPLYPGYGHSSTPGENVFFKYGYFSNPTDIGRPALMY